MYDVKEKDWKILRKNNYMARKLYAKVKYRVH